MPEKSYKPNCLTFMKNSDDPQWSATRRLLREHLSASPPEHPDFINSQVLAAIRRDEGGRREAPAWSLGRLVWPGFAMLAAALMLSLVLLPRDFSGRGGDEFVSQVIATRVADPAMSVTSFRVPDDRGVVLWIEGADYIPANHRVR